MNDNAVLAQQPMPVQPINNTLTGFCQAVIFVGFMLCDVDMKSDPFRRRLPAVLQCVFR
jgi:hypothetical protein